jgi:hypothetical protein
MRTMKKARTPKKKYKVKARKIKYFGIKPRERPSGSLPKARLILKEIVEENLETFKLLVRY